VCFLPGNSLASEFYMPTFRNTRFHLHVDVGMKDTYLPMKMEHTVLRNVGIQNSNTGELPRRKHTIFRTRRKLEIKQKAVTSDINKVPVRRIDFFF